MDAEAAEGAEVDLPALAAALMAVVAGLLIVVDLLTTGPGLDC